MAVPPSLTPCGDPELAVIEENRVHIRLVFEERKDIIVLRAWAHRDRDGRVAASAVFRSNVA
ncbi:hypothetical protein [Nannocystis pusilla]|uniref:hypothetical protein n=1 Tax=Nannocystis pusilla TaxID=889268 RepID=UPI003BF1716C